MNRVFSRAAAGFLAGILVFAAGTAGFLLSERQKTQEAASPRETPVVKIVREVMPGVVNISTRRIVRHAVSPWDNAPDLNGMIDTMLHGGTERTSFSLGSGSVIDESGLILTNSHVVAKASEISVTLSNGRIYQAKILDNDYRNDIALLALVDAPSGLKPIPPAAVNDLLIGETVIAVGNPYGLDSSVTSGVLSAVQRKIVSGGKLIFSDLLQTDAGVYPGSSGGPLLNLDGQMIGMNMSSFKDAPGIGFAIPLIRLENTVVRWMIPERFLGLSLGILPQVRTARNGDIEIFLAKVMPCSPAADAGLHAGDRLLSFQGRECRSLPELCKQFIRLKNGDSVTLETSGKKGTCHLTLVPLPQADGLLIAREKLGLELQQLTPQLAELLHYPRQEGIVVNDVPSALSGGMPLKRGDVLAALNGHAINTAADVARALDEAEPGDSIPAEFISFPEAGGSRTFLIRRRVMLPVRSAAIPETPVR